MRSGLRIHTNPPIAPMIKAPAPNSTEIARASLSCKPAYEKAVIIAPSRTPHPAIEIGMAAIKITGGTSNIDCTKPSGDPIALAVNHTNRTDIR